MNPEPIFLESPINVGKNNPEIFGLGQINSKSIPIPWHLAHPSFKPHFGMWGNVPSSPAPLSEPGNSGFRAFQAGNNPKFLENCIFPPIKSIPAPRVVSPDNSRAALFPAGLKELELNPGLIQHLLPAGCRGKLSFLLLLLPFHDFFGKTIPGKLCRELQQSSAGTKL